jgi:hypothetical protein
MGISMPNFDDPNFGVDDDEDDDDLTAELELLQHGAGGPTKKRPKDNKKKSGESCVDLRLQKNVEDFILGAPAQDLQSFHQDVNKLLSDIDRPMNDDDLSDVDEDELLVSLIIEFYVKLAMSNRVNYMKLLVKLKMNNKMNR